MAEPFRSGLVAIVGRPNTGKSTLVNRLVGQKISITSRRPQTTRNRTLGIRSTENAQIVYVDTPGLHQQTGGRQLNQMMNRAARGGMEGVDLIVLVIEATGWKPGDDPALQSAIRSGQPILLALNKIDRLPNRDSLLPLLSELQQRHPFIALVPISAATGENLQRLEGEIIPVLPEQPPVYDATLVTDQSERFLAAELLREQILRGFGQEVPHSVAVEIVEFRREPKHIHIDAMIWVEKEGQKAILIGKGGERLRETGRRARLAIQKAFDSKVWLGVWVKVRENWSDDLRVLKSFGYGEDR